MNRNTIQNLLESLSLVLVLSYFLINDIKLVFIGIIFSIYQINKNSIHSTIELLKNKQIDDDGVKMTDPIEINTNDQASRYSLVDTVEELGFIPSIKNEEDKDVA